MVKKIIIIDAMGKTAEPWAKGEKLRQESDGSVDVDPGHLEKIN